MSEDFDENNVTGEMILNECMLEHGKKCVKCGKCNLCDLDESKTCDNCCRCLGEADYRGIEITEIIVPKGLKFKRKKSTPDKTEKTTN